MYVYVCPRQTPAYVRHTQAFVYENIIAADANCNEDKTAYSQGIRPKPSRPAANLDLSTHARTHARIRGAARLFRRPPNEDERSRPFPTVREINSFGDERQLSLRRARALRGSRFSRGISTGYVDPVRVRLAPKHARCDTAQSARVRQGATR